MGENLYLILAALFLEFLNFNKLLRLFIFEGTFTISGVVDSYPRYEIKRKLADSF